MTQRILMVLTSHDRLGDTGEPTGFWLEELAAPYYACRDAGVEVEMTYLAGGQPPLDTKRHTEERKTEATRRLKQDPEAQRKQASKQPIAHVSAPDFDADFNPS